LIIVEGLIGPGSRAGQLVASGVDRSSGKRRSISSAPNSPDLNPIEEAFSKIKHFIHCHQQYYSAAEGNAIFFDMWEVLEIITPLDAAGYFFHAGYF